MISAGGVFQMAYEKAFNLRALQLIQADNETDAEQKSKGNPQALVWWPEE